MALLQRAQEQGLADFAAERPRPAASAGLSAPEGQVKHLLNGAPLVRTLWQGCKACPRIELLLGFFHLQVVTDRAP